MKRGSERWIVRRTFPYAHLRFFPVRRSDMISLWWQLFYEAIEEYDLEDWWKSTKIYRLT